MFTIKVTGFKNKDQAIKWLKEYEGGIEQNFEGEVWATDIYPYIDEMKEFEYNSNKTEFNLKLRS